MNMRAIVYLAGFLCLAFSGPLRAEPVSINRATAQGYVFNHAGNCYAVFPKHAQKGRSRRITLSTAAPVATGDGSILSFETVHDLAIAYVSPGFENRCRDSWALFSRPIQALLTSSASGTLIRISPSGLLERFPVRVRDFDINKIYGDIAGDATIQQGGSGGFLVFGDRLAGMLLTTEDGKTAEFLRVDEIHAELNRLVDTGVSVQATAPGQAASCPKSTVTFRSVICDREPVTPDFACSRLVSGRPLLIPASSLPVTIYAELDVPAAKSISRIALRSIVSDQNAAGAKSLKVMVDSSPDSNSPYWRYFGEADMPPTGAIDLNNGSQPYARRVKVTISSGWANAKPVNLSCLSIL